MTGSAGISWGLVDALGSRGSLVGPGRPPQHRFIDPNTMVVLHWGSGSDEIDGGLLDAQGRCFHFTGSLETYRGPIKKITAWNELNLSDGRSIHGELVDAGLELLRQAG